MKILWTRHARYKMGLLREHGFAFPESLVEELLRGHPKAEMQPTGERIAQTELDQEHVLRVVFSDSAQGRRIITVYPARRGRYET